MLYYDEISAKKIKMVLKKLKKVHRKSEKQLIESIGLLVS